MNLLSPAALNKCLKDNCHTGFTINKTKNYLNSLEITQTGKLHYSKVSYVAEHQLERFQIDLVRFDSGWFNHGCKYLI